MLLRKLVRLYCLKNFHRAGAFQLRLFGDENHEKDKAVTDNNGHVQPRPTNSGSIEIKNVISANYPTENFTLNEKDLEETFIKGSGPGGQAVNKSSNCVQLKHLPTGIIVKCHQTRSLLENRKIARKILFEKLEYMIKGEDSSVGQRMQRDKKKSAENKRRQKLREEAIAVSYDFHSRFSSKDSNDKQD
eukprot:gene1485-15919_t